MNIELIKHQQRTLNKMQAGVASKKRHEKKKRCRRDKEINKP